MIRLKIDGQDVPVDQKSDIAITVEFAEIEDPENSSSGYSKSVEVPFTPRSMNVFGYVNELYSKEQFNNALHTAEYLYDNTVVMTGVAQIEKITYASGAAGQTAGGSFHVSVIGASFDWITNAKKPMNELQGREVVKYTLDEIYANSVRTDTPLIKFFPVDRGAFWMENPAGDIIARRTLDLYDYHPFIDVWKALELIFDGYALRTSMMGKLRGLYCSGYMPTCGDMSYANEENDFLCGSTHTDTVYTFSGSKVPDINLFDDWTNEGYFVTTEGVLSVHGYTRITPTETLPTAFEVDLAYTTSVDSGGSFIDTFSLGPYFKAQFGFWDSEESQDCITSMAELTLNTPYFGNIKCDNIERYRSLLLYYTIRVVDEHTGEVSVEEFWNRLAGGIAAPDACFVLNIPANHLEYKLILEDASGSLHNISQIKGVQLAFIQMFEAGVQGPLTLFSLSFSKKISVPVHTLHKGEYFNLSTVFSMSRADRVGNNTSFKFGIGRCEISPDFKSAIGLGDDVGIGTVGGTVTQLEFLSAIRQMFNLMFYTNPITREVFIEPRTEFFNMDRADILDWRYKIDYAQPIEVLELGGDVGKEFKLAYADGGDVVQRHNWKNHIELGLWRTPLLNKTSDDVKEVVNPMFAPFLTRTVASMGMFIPQNEPEKTQDLIGDVDLDITPIIGNFTGVWYRSTGDDCVKRPCYPRLVFQDAGWQVNLSFSDLPKVPGLHQYYGDNISAYNYGRRITLYLHLEPQDVEAMQMPNSIKYDMRAVFLLCVNGEDVPCLLEKIEDYKPGSGASTKCQFISDPHIRLIGKEMAVITYDGEAITYRNKAIAYKQKSTD